MKKIYLDADFKCHVSDDGTYQAVETGFFDGKCDAFIEGYRFVPEGSQWTREDGVVFEGEMAAPWKPFWEIDVIQRSYEQALLQEQEKMISLLKGGTADVPV